MSSIRVSTISPALIALCLTLTFSVFAQDNNSAGNDGKSQVEVKTDRFSGKSTVTLKPQVLLDTPKHKVTMQLDSIDDFAGVTFESSSEEYLDFGDKQLHFLVDGKRMFIDTASQQNTPFSQQKQDEKGRTNYTGLISSLGIAQLEEIVAGKKVEMRLGTVELTLSQPVLANLREYVRVFANYAPSRRKRGGKQ
jgi:hypothetical protein